MTPRCSVCGITFTEHYGVDCPPAKAIDESATERALRRLHAKHKKFAEETNKMLTDLMTENARLLAELDQLRRDRP